MTRTEHPDRESRLPALRRIEELRGRRLVVLMNFDRQSSPSLPGLATHFDSTVKEPLFRVLKESTANGQGIDLCLYTRGGDTNAVWPIVGIIREFDPNFQVLVPFRCHSSGTLVALGASHIVMGRLGELSPVDPTTGNAFNPSEPTKPDSGVRLGISVEDVQAFREFILNQLGVESTDDAASWREHAVKLLSLLPESVHPVALGNVYRVLRQIEILTSKLLSLNGEKKDTERIVRAFTTEFYSHQHMINRHEASEILGDRVVHANDDLDVALDELWGAYKKSFELWQPYSLVEKIGDELLVRRRLIGGVVESTDWSYLMETNLQIRQSSLVPPGVTLQLPTNQPMPLIPGLPRTFGIDVLSQRWVRNPEPRGHDA
jgi:hypothetical protein